MIPDELKNATIFYLELANLFVKTHCLFVEPNLGVKLKWNYKKVLTFSKRDLNKFKTVKT